jgi:hypothetical protein
MVVSLMDKRKLSQLVNRTLLPIESDSSLIVERRNVCIDGSFILGLLSVCRKL